MSNIEGQESEAPDDIDFFLAHEEARPQLNRNRTVVDAAESIAEEMAAIKSSLWELAVTTALSGLTFFTNMALRRVMCVVTVQQELVKDGRLPGPLIGRASAPSSCGRGACGLPQHIAGGFLAPVRCGVLLYETGGLSALFRGGKVFAGFLLANVFFRSAQNYVLTNAVGPFLEPHLQSRAVRALWLVGVFPLMIHLTSWPLKAVRNLVMTNYMADMVAPAGKGQGREMASAADVHGSSPSDGESGYLYSDVAELWQVLCRELGGWRGILSYGAGVELGHTYSVLVMRLLVNEAFTALLTRAQAAAEREEVFMHPVMLALALNGLAAFSNVLLRPFSVVSTRMALIANPTEAVEGEGREEVQKGDVPKGRRYKDVIDCVRTIVREEGVLALWAGTPQVLVVNTLIPVAQMMLMGTVRLSFVDFGNAA